jgi:hypothetical protein
MIDYDPPPRTGGEKATLKGFLDLQRATLDWKLDGLSPTELQRSTVPSGICLLGIVKHMAFVELGWFCEVIGGRSLDLWDPEDPDADWRIESWETPEGVRAFYRDAIAQADEAIVGAKSLDVIGKGHGGREYSLRWVMVHMVEETARHAGHADILREQIDGATGYLPPR